jgi:3-oxoacyl-[acyl-carrier protein] reductase
MLDINLSGKTAIVAGSSQGIGRAVAMELAALGANIILVARNISALELVRDQLPVAEGQQHSTLAADFSHPEELKERINRFLEKVHEVHILVNNTGGPAPGPANEAHEDDFRIAFNQHLICNHILMQAVLPKMKAIGYGRIINIISTSVKQPIPGLGVSNTIRAAVGNWSKTLSLELAKFGITVNNVLPGATYTGRLQSIISNKALKKAIGPDEAEKEMLKEIPAGRFAAPEEIAYAVAFLASPAAGYINGINVPVDGGRTASL